MSQRTRILAALERGPISPVDFIAPTVDGGPPILRVAARVQDLRNAGHGITTDRAPSGIAVYTLVREGHTAGSGSTARELGSLASPNEPDPAVPDISGLFECADPIEGLTRSAIFGWEEAA